MDDHFDVPGRIVELQKLLNMSNHELAERCGVDDATVSRWIRPGANLKLQTVEKICYAMGVTLSEFFKVESGPERRKNGHNQRLRRLWRAADEKQKALVVFIGEAIVVRGFFSMNECSILDEIQQLAHEFHNSQEFMNMEG